MEKTQPSEELCKGCLAKPAIDGGWCPDCLLLVFLMNALEEG